jgi:hypothetical protein
MAPMLAVFEVHLVPSHAHEPLLSDEQKRETQAQVMTVEEATQVGFGGLGSLGPNVRLVAVNARDERWILRTLESHPAVGNFRVHHVE